MRMRNALLVLPNLTLGGAERQAVELALRLPARGWQPHVLAAEMHGPQVGKLQAAGIPLHGLDAQFWRRKGSPLFWLNVAAVVARIRRHAAATRADIVQSFLFWQNQVAIPAGALAPLRPAVIAGRRNFGAYKDGRRFYQAIENATNRWCDAVVCNSEAVRDDCLRRERIDPARLRVIPNGVDADRFASSDAEAAFAAHPELRDAAFVVGAVGNMKRQKRHDLFLRAFAEIRREEPGAKGVIVGRDLGELAALERLRRDLGLEAAVVFAGGVADPAPYYRAMTAMVLSSDYEGMPNVVLEAMAAGTPIVARAVAGIAELGGGGCIDVVDPGEAEDRLVEAMTRKVLALLRDAPRREAMATAARQRVRAHFSLDAMADAYARLYAELRP